MPEYKHPNQELIMWEQFPILVNFLKQYNKRHYIIKID